MLELIAGYILILIGYVLGSLDGRDYRAGSDIRQDIRHTKPERKDEHWPDYSHLKYKAMAKKPSDTSLSHMSAENIHEKVYDVEVVEDETHLAKMV